MGASWRHMRTDRSAVETRLGRETVRRVLTFARPHRGKIGVFLSLTVLDAVLVVVSPLLIQRIVDDGIATGATMRAALRGVARSRPARLILAVPVAPADTVASLASECDELVCLATPEPFYAVGAHYRDFAQTSDEEVQRLMLDAARLEPAR